MIEEGIDPYKQEELLQPNAGIVVGITERLSISACTEFPCFGSSPQAQTIQHCLLRHLFQRVRVKKPYTWLVISPSPLLVYKRRNMKPINQTPGLWIIWDSRGIFGNFPCTFVESLCSKSSFCYWRDC